MNTKHILVLAVGLCILQLQTRAAETLPQPPTNTAPFALDTPVRRYLDDNNDRPHTVLSDIMDHVSERSTYIVSDKIGLVARVRLTIKAEELRYGYHEYYNGLGQDAITDSFKDGIREVVADRLPLGEWESNGKTLFNRFTGSFLHDSIGNTEEERLELISSEPQSTSLSRSWWKGIREENKGLLAYGVRPIRADPHFYATIGLGRVEGRPVLIDLRVYSMLLDNQIGNPKVKIGMILPTGNHSHIVLGCSLYPLDMGLEEDRSRGSLRYERVIFKNHRRTTFFSAGIEANQDNALASIMITSNF